MEIGFLPGRISLLTLSGLMSSVLTNYVSVHVCISVEVLVEARAVEQWSWIGLAPGKYKCFINTILLMFTSPNSIIIIMVGIKVFYVKCNY